MTIALRGTLVLVGAGKMGGALLEGWLGSGIDARQIVAFDPAPPDEVKETLRGVGCSDYWPAKSRQLELVEAGDRNLAILYSAERLPETYMT